MPNVSHLRGIITIVILAASMDCSKDSQHILYQGEDMSEIKLETWTSTFIKRFFVKIGFNPSSEFGEVLGWTMW